MTETKRLTLKEYFEKIENHFCNQRGAPLILSPLDFQRVIMWYEMSWNVDEVCEGISRYFDRLKDRKIKPRRAIVLSFCERHIEDAINERRRALLDLRDGIKEFKPATAIKEYLGNNISILENALSAGARSGMEAKPLPPAIIRFIEGAIIKMKSLLVKEKITINGVERVLGQVDHDLGNLCRLSTPEEIIKGWEMAAREEIGEIMPDIPQETLSFAVEVRLTRLALNYFQLPRISLAYMPV